MSKEPKPLPMSNAQLLAKIAELEAKNAQLAANQKKSQAVTLKVSNKGALSIYGINTFPVTLFKSQWVTVLDKADDIRGFIKANESKLANNKEESEAMLAKFLAENPEDAYTKAHFAKAAGK